MASITVLLFLAGCMDTATRLWNGGTYISKKKNQAYDQCIDQVRAQDPEMAKINKTDAEMSEFSRRMRPCMQRKGYLVKSFKMRPVPYRAHYFGL